MAWPRSPRSSSALARRAVGVGRAFVDGALAVPVWNHLLLPVQLILTGGRSMGHGRHLPWHPCPGPQRQEQVNYSTYRQKSGVPCGLISWSTARHLTTYR